MRHGTDIKTHQASWVEHGKRRVKLGPHIDVIADPNAGKGWIEALRVLYEATNLSTVGHRKKESSKND